MTLSTKLAAAAIGGLLLVVGYAPAWAGSADTAPVTTQSPATPTADHSLVGVLNPIFADAAPHQAQKACKPDSLYSQHSVVGEADACFINHNDVRTQAPQAAGVGGVL
jgi:hypothetical protein